MEIKKKINRKYILPKEEVIEVIDDINSQINFLFAINTQNKRDITQNKEDIVKLKKQQKNTLIIKCLIILVIIILSWYDVKNIGMLKDSVDIISTLLIG